MYECKRFISVFDGSVVEGHMGLLGSDFIEVDEFIQPIISILIHKGFMPRFSCSGHVCDNKTIDESFKYKRCYITFKENIPDLIEKEVFKMPDGFYLERTNNTFYAFRIVKSYRSDKDRFIQILDTMRILYEWAIALPYLSSGEIEGKSKKPINKKYAGPKYNVGERISTLRGNGIIENIDINNESILYHVKLDNDKGSYIFQSGQVFDIIKRHMFNPKL